MQRVPPRGPPRKALGGRYSGRVITRCLRAWLVAAVLAAVAALAVGEETQGARYYQMRLAKVGKAAAARLWEAAEKARRESLFRFARSQAQRVLELDSDHRQARTLLGYVKRDEAWEIELGASARIPAENETPPGGAKLADAETAWRLGPAVRADADVASLYAALGDECATKGFRVESEAAYGKALELDRDNAVAHRGLGHVRFGEGLWLLAEANRAFAAARVARPLDEPSRYDEMFGEKLVKAESGHFRVESPHAQAVLAGYLESCERVFAAYLCDFGVDPHTKAFPMTPLFCVIDTDTQWDRWINRMTQGNPGFWRPRTCHWARDRWACAVRNHDGATDATRRDRLAHEAVHMLNLALWDMADGSWLDDALAYRYCLLTEGATYSFCLAPRKAGYANSMSERNWMEPSQWKALLKEAVGKGDDPSLRLIVNKRSYDLPLFASVKAWSMVDFLMRRDRAAFIALVREQKGEQDPIGLLETRFGKDVESLDDAWRKWVTETY